MDVRSSRNLTGRSTVAGLFTSQTQAEQAIRDLQAAGFSGDQIGIAMRDQAAQSDMAENTGTKAAEGAVSGAVGGGLLGGLVGLLVGLGALAIPGIGPVVAGGALATALGVGGGTAAAGAGIGATAGGILGTLVGMGIPDEEARHFESGFNAGGVLVTVNAGANAMNALAILERNGADTGPGSLGAGNQNQGPGAGTAMGTTGGGLAGAATGAAVGTGVAGPIGTIPGAVIGGVTGAGAGARAGADADDAEGEWTTDQHGNRVRRINR